MAQSIHDSTGRKSGRSSLPSNALRAQLRLLDIGLLFHEESALRGMIERRLGVQLPDTHSPDQLAKILIELEEAKESAAMRSLIRQYSQPGSRAALRQ